MLRAKDIMTRNPVTVSPETKITEIAGILLHHGFNGLPVVDDDGRLVGIVCQSDLIVQQKKIPMPSVFNLLDALIPITPHQKIADELKKIAATRVADAMTPEPVWVDPETSLEDVATLMVEENIHTIPVVDHGKLVGVIGKEDILRTIMPAAGNE